MLSLIVMFILFWTSVESDVEKNCIASNLKELERREAMQSANRNLIRLNEDMKDLKTVEKSKKEVALSKKAVFQTFCFYFIFCAVLLQAAR